MRPKSRGDEILGRSAVRQVRRVISRRVEALEQVYVWHIQLLQPTPESLVIYGIEGVAKEPT
jgi:hypothetical protein